MSRIELDVKTIPIELDVIDRLVKKFGAICKEEGVEVEVTGTTKSFDKSTVYVDLRKKDV